MAEGGFEAVVSAEGEVVLPGAMLGRLGWGAGTRLEVREMAEGVLLTRAGAVFAATRGEDVFGCLGPAGEARTVEEMEAGIRAEVGRRRAAGRY